MDKKHEKIISKQSISEERKDRLASALKLNIKRRKKIIKKEE